MLKKKTESAEDKNMLDDLLSLLSSVEFGGFIVETCARKFHIIYCSPLQKQTWKEIFTKLDNPLVLTVSKGYMENVKMCNHETGDIILYSLVFPLDGDCIPLFQVVSEKTDKYFIEYSIKEWLRLEIPRPSSVLIPPYKPVIEGATKAFNRCSLDHYMYHLLRKNEGIGYCLTGLCFLRFDILPILLYIEKLDKDVVIQKFYAKFMFHLSLSDDLKTFNSEVQKLYVFMLSNRRNKYLIDERKILDIKFQMNPKINTLFEEFNSIKNYKSNAGFNMNDVIDASSSTSTYNYIKEIESKAKEHCTPYTGDLRFRSNTCHIGEKRIVAFTNFLSYFPFWTNIYSKPESVDSFTQLKTSKEYNELLSNDDCFSDCVNSNRSLSSNPTNVTHSVDSQVPNVLDHRISGFKVDDFVISHSKLIQEKLLKTSETISTLKKRKVDDTVPQDKQPKLQKLEKSKEPVENWGGKADVQKKSRNDLTTMDLSYEASETNQFLENCEDQGIFQNTTETDKFYNYESLESCLKIINDDHDYFTICTTASFDHTSENILQISNDNINSEVHAITFKSPESTISFSSSTYISDGREARKIHSTTAQNITLISTPTCFDNGSESKTLDSTIANSILPISTSTQIVKIKTGLAETMRANKKSELKNKKKHPSTIDHSEKLESITRNNVNKCTRAF
ncbi:uncharacterized protein LOC130446071 isoform X2 [Diorhabda sublineata]|uniref:uncharacterized protein LOC130446071 isoform X2 n=1 Tax=Diorhabda sublineata TaxID=1163346 RepID=UPI0024E06D1E|nr:uncharacterized protein LOC130446071 isoform X2 [Diorhabda sublineata]